jgi:starch phosphorylase
MKFALNGALTIGTLDGANVEMRDRIGADHFFLFGLQTEQVAELKVSGYNPFDYYLHYAELKAAIDMIQSGAFSNGNGDVFKPLTDSLLYNDPYLVMADFADYVRVQEQVSEVYKDTDNWTRKSILNVARMGYFSSDRSIREYCDKVWHVGHNGKAKSNKK